MLGLLGSSCNKDLIVGTCQVQDPATDGGDFDAQAETLADELPWWSGFEGGFCDFRRAGGFCYQRGSASFRVVTSPVHSGSFAAAFTVSSNADDPGTQARCVRQGTLPASAYYGAWYYVPPTQADSAFWNLFHFQGQSANSEMHGLWDVQLTQDASGQLRLAVFDFIHQRQIDLPSAPPIPIETWFHIEFYLARAADTTGAVSLYQDGQPVLELTALETDDSEWGQWYVGNLGLGLNPKVSTVYVDDVTIDVTR